VGGEDGTARPNPLTVASAHADAGPAGVVSILAVLVLYRCALRESETWQRLLPQVERLSSHAEWRCAFRLLLCENEAADPMPAGLPDWVEYRSRSENAGLSWAYNEGLVRARETGAEWLLTLDHDTRLPPDFLEQSIAHALGLSGRPEIAAILPQLVTSTGRVYSPMIAKLGYEQAVPLGFTGVAKGDVRGFNSAALMRVSWLDSIGGYSPLFWLDYLDHATFRMLGSVGGKVWIAGELQVEHHLSIEDGRASMSEARFANFIQAESGFLDLYGSALEGWLYSVRLVFRLLNQRRRGDPAFFMQQTRALLTRRLKLSRRRRLQIWMERQERK
jgi:GT2 family glycosyltransferase